MKRILIFVSLLLLMIVFTACSASEEAEELVDYHNTYLEEVNPIGDEVDELVNQMSTIEDDEEASDLFQNEVLPLVEEVEEFIDSRAPETDVVKELHELRSDQLDSWFAAFDLMEEGIQVAVETEDEEEVFEIFEQSDEKFYEAIEKAGKADERFKEMADEHNVELEDEEEE